MVNKSDYIDNDHCAILLPTAALVATTNSSAVNLQGYNSCEVIVIVGAASADTLSGSLYWTVTLEESDTYNTGFTTVSAAETVDGETTATNSIVIDANAECGLSYKLGYVGNAKYLRITITETGSMSYGNLFAAVAIMGHERIGPGNKTGKAVAAA